jgi:CDP-diglyceride synthetase
MDWSRLLTRFAGFAGVGALWGSACGLAFGVVIWTMGRRKGASPLSAAKLTLWGAIGGAAFPLVLYTPVVLSRGVYGLIPFYGMLTGISALFGALCGRTIFSLAQRAPAPPVPPALTGASPFDLDHDVPIDRRERVR